MADNQFINFNSQDVADMYRRNQYARMLQEQANAPIERASYKGIEAPIHPVQGVAKLAAALLAGHQQNQMDERYANEKAAAEQKLVAERERSNQAFKDFQQGFQPKVGYGAPTSGGTTGAGAGPGDIAPQGQMTATALSPQERLAHAMTAYGSPDERVRSYGQAMVQNENTMAENESRAAEKAATEATRVKERDEDIKIRADEFKALRDESAQKRKEAAEAKPQLPPKGIEAQQELLNKRASVNSITEDLNAVLKDLHTGRLVLGPRRNLENELKNKLGNSTPESIRYSSFLNTMEKMRNDVVRLNTGTQTEGDSQRAMNELMGSLGDTKNVKNRIGELIGLSKRAGEQHETAVNTMRKEYGAEPMDFKSMAKTKPIMGGGAVDVLPTGATVSNWNQ